uniref:Uncharacterized protein n=1 Tax=Timema genevievae TaxID=629358 RepID=A0A7R9PN71_TIMGE|nr:unnamed protein product [Timema genevievae]
MYVLLPLRTQLALPSGQGLNLAQGVLRNFHKDEFFIPPGVVDQYNNKESGQDPSSPKDSHTCPHKGPCWRYILKMTGKYGGLGLALQLVRKLLPQMKFLLRTPSDLVKRVYNRNNLLFGAYLAGYVGLYTMTSCVLCRVAGRDSALHAIPAGFLAGLVYPLQPNTAIVFTSMTTAVLLLARRAVVLGLVSHWPKLTGLIFALSFAILTHGLATDRDTRLGQTGKRASERLGGQTGERVISRYFSLVVDEEAPNLGSGN